MQVPEWLKGLKGKSRSTDRIMYLVNSDVIQFTEQILREYGEIEPSNEGLVYWCGKKDGDRVCVCSAVAPRATSSPGKVSTSHESNAEFVRMLSSQKLIHIGQVHSHPDKWVG